MKRPISMLLVALLLACCTSVGAYADEETAGDITPFYEYAKNVTAILSIDSSGNATCQGRIIPKESSYSCSITVQLKRKSGSTWTTVATWSDSGKGLSGASAGGTRSVSSGYSYKVSVSATVKNASGDVVENPSKDSSVKTY